MGTKRQKIQDKQAFKVEGGVKLRSSPGKGTEVSMAKLTPESPAPTDHLMEEACERENLKKALRRVRANKGSPGIDGMTVDTLPGYLKEHWLEIREQLLEGTYKPKPVKRVAIPKGEGGVRTLGIPTVLDRFIQQALLQVLQRRWDKTFSPRSYGFRPGRSAHQAVRQAQTYITGGYGYVVDIDLDKFFDGINHDMLMGRIAKRVTDKRVLKLIRAFLKAGVMEGGLGTPTDEGTPQGGPLSPLLSNLFLDDLDRELKRRGHRFVRYADGCTIYVRSERAGHRVMESISQFITKKLKLKVNREKSAVARPSERTLLGFSFTGGKDRRRRIASKALKQFKHRVRELTRRTRGVSIEQMVGELSRYLARWGNYFGFCETPSVLACLDSWIRRRLRSTIWKQWKRGRTRFTELRKHGVNRNKAAQAAGSAHGPWRISRTLALSIALPNAYFSSLGLPSLVTRRIA